MLFVFDNSEALIDLLDDSENEQIYLGGAHTEELGKSNIFEFQIPAHLDQATNIIENNYVGFKDIDGNFQMFEIMMVDEVHSETLLKSAYCEHVYYELNDEFIISISQPATSPTLALTSVLAGTRWEVGTITVTGTSDFSIDRKSVISGLQHVANIFDGEFKFRLVISGSSITHRYVDFLTRRGTDTFKRFEYNEDLQEIKRTVDMSNVKTAMYGYGKSIEQEDGSILRTNFSTITWTNPPNPANKPNLQVWVGDSTALALYGRAGGTRHRYGYFEDQDESDPATLLQSTWDNLQTVNNPRITYEARVEDLEQISGLQSEAIRLGDTISVIDNEFKPSLKLNARIITLKRYLKEPEKNEVTLGNFAPIITDESFITRDTVNMVHDYKGSWDSKFSEATGVPTSALDGIIDVLNNEIFSAGGYVYITDSDGLIVYDQPTKALATKAVRIKGGIVAISNQKVAGEFVFRTFMTGDGVTANEVNTGTLNANLVTVQGDTKFYWNGTNIYVINPSDSNKQIRIGKYDGTNYGIAFTLDNGTTWNTIMDWSGVTVNTGNFVLKDQFDTLNYSRVQENFLIDSSFEQIKVDETTRSSDNDVKITFSIWKYTGTDVRVYYPLIGGGFGVKPIFGDYAAVIGPNSSYYQDVRLTSDQFGRKYTFSAFGSAYTGTTSSGTLEMYIEVKKFDGVTISTISKTQAITSGDNLEWIRFYQSIDITTLTYTGGYTYQDARTFRITFRPHSTTPNLKCLVDGTQIVPFDKPIIYTPDTTFNSNVITLWRSLDLFYTLNYSSTSFGDMTEGTFYFGNGFMMKYGWFSIPANGGTDHYYPEAFPNRAYMALVAPLKTSAMSNWNPVIMQYFTGSYIQAVQTNLSYSMYCAYWVFGY